MSRACATIETEAAGGDEYEEPAQALDADVLITAAAGQAGDKAVAMRGAGFGRWKVAKGRSVRPWRNVISLLQLASTEENTSVEAG